jgi:hypothetical protein
MSLEKVEGYATLRKDTISGGVINVDETAYQQRLMAKQSVLKRNQEVAATQNAVANLNADINNIKAEMKEIKELLLSVVVNINKGN